jgi:hypothetical protein
MTNYSLTVSRKELAKALALATMGVRKGKPSEVRFNVANGFLEIMGPGAAQSVQFQGTWPSAVLVEASVLKKIASRLPSSDPTVVRIENSRLFFGGFSIEARVLDIAPEGTQLPIDATGVDVCLAIARIGEVRVAASIGERALQNAKKELLARIDQAVHALQPYGVTLADVDALVRRALQQKATINPK